MALERDTAERLVGVLSQMAEQSERLRGVVAKLGSGMPDTAFTEMRSAVDEMSRLLGTLERNKRTLCAGLRRD